MRKQLCAAAFFLTSCLLLPVSARAQFTTVTATVQDPNGIPYAGAVLNAVLVPGASGGYRLSGQPYSGQIGPVTLDSSGSFTVNFGDVTLITPGSPQWKITISSAAATIGLPLGTGPQQFTFTSSGTTISGSSPVSLTTSLNALAPKLTNFAAGSGTGTVTSVSCGNLINVFTCSIATPTTTPAFTYTAVTSGPVLDCSAQVGADMGAKLNACITALPASGGIADATKFVSPQTISTAVVNNKAAVILTCGIAITQTANISLTAVNAAWHGCPDQSTVITKGANIDQFTMSANYTSVDYVTLVGASASFTGNGVVVSGGSQTDVSYNRISDEAGSGIVLTGSTNWGQITRNDLSGFVTHAIQGTASGGFEFWINHNKIDDTATATGSNVELVSTVLLTENDISNSHGFLAVHNTNSNTNASVYSGNYLNSVGTGGQVISVGGPDYIHHNTMYNVGAHAVIIGGASITDNNLQPQNAGADVIDAPTTLRPIITGNLINFVVTGVAGFCAININGSVGWEGGYVGHNTITFSGTGSGADYGICLTTTAAQFGQSMVVENNAILSSTGGGTGSAGVFFNNTAGITTNGSNNIFRSNQCILVNICVARTDAQNLQNYYENNASNVSSSLFSAGGSTNDVVIMNLGTNGGGTGLTFANLPTAGNGSQIYVTDAKCTVTATSGGTGCLLNRINGAWIGTGLINVTNDGTTWTYSGTGGVKATGGPVSSGQVGTAGVLNMVGSTSGTASFTAPAVAGTTSNPVTASNALLLPAGTAAAPGLTLVDSSNGFFRQLASVLSFASSTNDTLSMYSGGIREVTTACYQWSNSSTNSTGTFDTALSRGSAGVVTVDTGTCGNAAGTLKSGAYATGTNCSSSASPAVCSAAPAGSVVIAAAASTVTVNTTAVTANSQIFLTADDTLGTKLSVTCNSTLATLIGGLAVTARTAGTSFQITSGATPAVNPLCISYFIVN